MRKVDDGEEKRKEKRKEKNGDNSGPLTSLPVDRMNDDRLQRRPLVPISLTRASSAMMVLRILRLVLMKVVR